MLHHYAYGDLALRSEVPLLDDLKGPPASTDSLSIEAGNVPGIIPLTPELSCTSVHDGYGVSLGRHRAWTDGYHRIVIDAELSGGDEGLRYFVLDHVIPRVLGHRGRLVLHAASVLFEDDAVALIGPTGVGKSTLAASFTAHESAKTGDDCLILQPSPDDCLAIPGYPGLRLMPDSAAIIAREELTPLETTSGKYRFRSSTEGIRHRRLRGCFFIEPASTESAQRLPSADALLRLLANAFSLDRSEREWHAARLRGFAQIAETVPCFELKVPRDYGRLDAVRALIYRCITELAP